MWPKRLLRSSFYWKLIGYDHRFNIADRINARKGLPANERVVQDIEVPIENTTAYLEWFLENIPIEPIWLCPLRLRDDAGAKGGSTDTSNAREGEHTRRVASRPWPLYPLEPHRTYVNVGFWSAVPVTPGDPGHANKLIEREVAELDGHKSLYSESFYSPEEFDELYGGEHYRLLRKRYDPKGRLLDLYAKAVKRQ